MVRTQLYLSDDMYKTLKEKAKKNNMTFAAYVRVKLEPEMDESDKKKTLYQKFPFMKYAGMFKGEISPDELTNEAIDKAIYDL
jgi:hypothetical protein